MEKNNAAKRIYDDENAFAGNEKIEYFPACKGCLLAYYSDVLGFDHERFTCQIYDGVDADGEIDETRDKPEQARSRDYACPYKVIDKE